MLQTYSVAYIYIYIYIYAFVCVLLHSITVVVWHIQQNHSVLRLMSQSPFHLRWVLSPLSHWPNQRVLSPSFWKFTHWLWSLLMQRLRLFFRHSVSPNTDHRSYNLLVNSVTHLVASFVGDMNIFLSEYSYDCFHLQCYTHNVSADISFGLLLVCHVEIRSLHRASIECLIQSTGLDCSISVN